MIKHYDFAGAHWRETKGYETYQVGADMIREAGMETAGEGYVDANIYGTPEQIIEQYRGAPRRRRRLHGQRGVLLRGHAVREGRTRA